MPFVLFGMPYKSQFERNERLNNYGTYGVWRELFKANKGATPTVL